MKCRKCNQNVPDGSTFCLHCGTQLQVETDGSEKSRKPSCKMLSKKGIASRKVLVAGVIFIAAVAGIYMAGKPTQYHKAVKYKEEGNFPAAMAIFEKMEDYRDAEEELQVCSYQYARKLMDQGELDSAKEYFQRADGYQDADEMASQCDYQKAENLLKQGKYSEAEDLFASLEEFRDSKEQVSACRYYRAEVLFESGDYEAARDLFLQAHNYLESESYIDECWYQLALARLTERDYLMAYENLCAVSEDYKDTEDLIVECLYRISRDLYDAGKYSSAYAYGVNLNYYVVDTKQYDVAFLSDAKLRHIETLIARGEDTHLGEALALLNEMTSTQRVKNLIWQAEKQQKQNIYDDGMDYLKGKQYTKAIAEFEKVMDFSDAKQQWQEAAYGFVRVNKSMVSLYKQGYKQTEAEKFYEYAKLLSDQNYRDSRDFYKELTAWHVDITMNASESSTAKATSVSRFDIIYAHLKLSGGPMDGKTKIRYVFTFPSGSTTSGKFEWVWQEGDTGACYCYYNDPYRSAVGTCYVKIYDESGNLIGKDQIRVTY